MQVLRYSDGAHVRTIGSRGSGNTQFSYPTGIAVDGEGNVAVFDRGNARVQVHRLSDGAHIRTIGSKGSGNGQFGVSNSLRARLCAHNARGHMCAYMYQICQLVTGQQVGLWNWRKFCHGMG